MEDFAIDIMIGKGSQARSIRLDLPKFTLVGATTRAGLLTAPLRDRFGVICKMDFYTESELKKIILRSANVLAIEIDDEGATEMARRSRGTPRASLDRMEVDKMGLDRSDRLILTTIMEKFAGGPVGLDTLAAAIGEDAGTIEDVYEPYLIQNGFINRTPKGRVATQLCYKHFGIER